MSVNDIAGCGNIADYAEGLRRHGSVAIEGLLTTEFVGALDAAVTTLVASRVADGSMRGCGVPVKPFLQTFNAWADDPTVRRLALSEAMGEIASGLMDVARVRLMQDQILMKEPGDHASPWHVDQDYWPIDAAACSVWVPLHDVSLSMGPIEYVAGSHRRWSAPRPSELSDDNSDHDSDEDARPPDVEAEIVRHGWKATTREFAAGDVEVHDGRTLHRAGANDSAVLRRVVVLHYMDAEARLAAPATRQQHDHVTRFGWDAFREGEVLRGPVAPLV
jgi:ectoine hydroxylase-related dioxygenase (phytanoyl-CoA dioxygenase family)